MQDLQEKCTSGFKKWGMTREPVREPAS
uniref:Uncharacterized protein n=1 Tax=Rhizophora mucronata TaxID=61149 RepID=A0A2P2PN53_RHIMU